MRWFKGRYVQYLEKENSRLHQDLAAQRLYSDQLIERLLRRAGVPSLELPREPSTMELKQMLEAGSGSIFDDIDVPKEPDQVDNRTEKYDEFVS